MLYNVHAQSPNLKVYNDAMELSEAGETEEDVDDVSGQLSAFLPVFS